MLLQFLGEGSEGENGLTCRYVWDYFQGLAWLQETAFDHHKYPTSLQQSHQQTGEGAVS